VRKIGAPGHEEYGIGAVVDGKPPQLVMNEEAVRMVRPPEGYVQAEMNKQLKEISRQRKVLIKFSFSKRNLIITGFSCQTYLGDREPIPLAGKIAIVVDDGIATGGTARVAMKALRQEKVARAILCSPVSPKDTLGNQLIS
jgi:putative phosphoribosyl transferase